jgi:hypothetical protein
VTTIEEPAAVDEPAKSGPVAPPPAPLGRSVSADRAGAAELHTVRLLNLPISLFLRAREHHDDLIRELTLMAIRRHSGEAPEVSERLANSSRSWVVATARARAAPTLCGTPPSSAGRPRST